MSNKNILFLRKNKAFLKIKPIEKKAGISNSVLVKAVDGKMALPEKWEKPLDTWLNNFISGFNTSDQSAGPQEPPKKPILPAKPTTAPKQPAVKAASRPKKEVPIADTDNSARIAELENELKNPPKNPTVGLKMWKKVREEELKKLKADPQHS